MLEIYFTSAFIIKILAQNIPEPYAGPPLEACRSSSCLSIVSLTNYFLSACLSRISFLLILTLVFILQFADLTACSDTSHPKTFLISIICRGPALNSLMLSKWQNSILVLLYNLCFGHLAHKTLYSDLFAFWVAFCSHLLRRACTQVECAQQADFHLVVCG